jgi:hypothetical protein
LSGRTLPNALKTFGDCLNSSSSNNNFILFCAGSPFNEMEEKKK